MALPAGSPRLIFRLSSLGDVVLALSALEPAGPRVDWVVCQEWVELVHGHPRISKVWPYDRATGLKGWVRLCQELRRQGYSEVLDLHGSLRTQIARLLIAAVPGVTPKWKSISKQRFRKWGYQIFKALWPKAWRPVPQSELCGRLAGGTGSERPRADHLGQMLTLNFPLPRKPFFCVMPSSKWPGKEWPPESYAELLAKAPLLPVVLGTHADVNSTRLVGLLQFQKTEHLSLVGKLSLNEVCQVLRASKGYLGCDTGIAHLAQALGKPSWIFYGPTASDGAFGPWGVGSQSVESSLWCRPCGKDGRACFRVVHRHRCIKDLPVEKVRNQMGALHEVR